MRRIALAALAASVLTVAAPAEAYHSFGYHWRHGTNPFVLRVVESLSPGYLKPVGGAASDWSRSKRFDMVTELGDASADARRNCAAMGNLQIHICNSNFNAGWAGLTQVTYSGHHVVSMRVRLNDRYLTTAGLRRLVACHELGHALGLAHRAESTSCMKVGLSNAHPDSHDYAQLARIYKHTDSVLTGTSEVRTITTQ